MLDFFGGFATLPHFSHFSILLNLKFLLHVPGGYILCCTYVSCPTQTHAYKSRTRKKNLVLAVHEESAERAESHDRRRFFNRKYGRNREPVLVVNIVVDFIVEGKIF